MSTLVIKNLPDDLHDKLRAQAVRHHRSMTKEAVTLIEAGVAIRPANTNVPPPVKSAGGPLDWDEIEAAISDGRYVSFQSQAELDAWMDELRADRDDLRR